MDSKIKFEVWISGDERYKMFSTKVYYNEYENHKTQDLYISYVEGMNNYLNLLEREAYSSVSGVTVECAHWPGYDIAFRMISKHTTGAWKPSVAEAIEAYTQQKEIENNVK